MLMMMIMLSLLISQAVVSWRAVSRAGLSLMSAEKVVRFVTRLFSKIKGVKYHQISSDKVFKLAPQ